MLSSSCKKNNNDGVLPLLTFEGKNTIGCYINGQPWVPKGIYDPTGIQYAVPGGAYYIYPVFPGIQILITTNSPDGEIELFVRNYAGQGYIKPGNYLLNRNTGDLHFGTGQIHSYGSWVTNNRNYITDSLHTGFIEIIKADSINKIVSGRFEFNAYNPTENKTITITEGRFDIK